MPQYEDFFQLPIDATLIRNDVICRTYHDMEIGPADAVLTSTDESAFLVLGWAGRSPASLQLYEYSNSPITAWRKKPKQWPSAPNFKGWVQIALDTELMRGDSCVAWRGPHAAMYNSPEQGSQVIESGRTPALRWAAQMDVAHGDWAVYREEVQWLLTVFSGNPARHPPLVRPKAPALRLALNPYFSRPLPLP